MKRNGLITAGAVIGAGLIATFLSAFQVPQWQDAIVLQLGKPVRVIIDQPGLHWRVPFIENVHYIDKRVLNFHAPAQALLNLDQKRIVISAYVRYQIEDPLRFYQVGRTEMRAERHIRS